jgi:hypothetical protein
MYYINIIKEKNQYSPFSNIFYLNISRHFRFMIHNYSFIGHYIACAPEKTQLYNSGISQRDRNISRSKYLEVL